MIDSSLNKVKRLIPAPVFNFFNPPYHLALSYLGALLNSFPSKKIKVIAVTGTKGKSSTTELINTILEQAGHKTALSNTIRFKIDNESKENLYKMSMPGRMFMQNFIRKAVNAGCDYAIIEMTSQGSLLYRHRFIDIDTLVITNISPEHIEAHGSFENYIQAKLNIARQLEKSDKSNRTIIVNGEDKECSRFLDINVERKISYSIHDLDPFIVKDTGLEFTLGRINALSPLSGEINLYNIAAAVSLARSENVSDETIIGALEKFKTIPGRLQKIIVPGKNIEIIVDYAHTPDSLEKFYKVFRERNGKKICVLGGTGGGRDAWKRSEMGKIADNFCHEIILTNEDPYDEDPRKIVDDVALGVKKHKAIIIMDRREAIKQALKMAQDHDVVLITGKGTDPYIMGPKGTKIPWSDAEVVRELISE
jgi:UDP-N-acetylmuramoyl-L-alanyl-D-glutamate--2,6-diaminopimelate ligase